LRVEPSLGLCDVVRRRAHPAESHGTGLFSPSSAKEGVRGLFKTVLDDLDDPRTPRVCLLARSVSSDVLAKRDLQKFVQTDMAAFVGAFSKRFKSAKDAGELPSQFNAEVVAQIIATYLQGLYHTALLSYDRSQLDDKLTWVLPASASNQHAPSSRTVYNETKEMRVAAFHCRNSQSN